MSLPSTSKSRWIPPLELVFTLILLVGFGSCRFDRGDRYWSGRPQPIGIDFSQTGVVGVYADGPNNFTTLGAITHHKKKQYDYATYIYILYSRRIQGERDLPDSSDELVSEPWYQGVLSRGGSWVNDMGKSACYNLPPILRGLLNELCFPEESDILRKPQSKYQKLLSNLRKKRLQAIMPKRFRTPQPSQGLPPLTSNNFLLSLLELLEELKRISVADHNITITSATISRPWWVSNEVNDLFDEACLLADIEVLEQPHSRVDLSTKEITSGESVLVIDHGYYHFDITRQVWSEERKAFQGQTSQSDAGYGLIRMLASLSTRILNSWSSTNCTCNAETGGMEWVRDMGTLKIVYEVQNSRIQLKYGSGLAQDVEFANASTTVNLTDSTGYSRVLNMTGQDILDAEKDYIKKVSDMIKSGLLHWDSAYGMLIEIEEYQNFLSDESGFDDNWLSKFLDILQDIPPPVHLGSWQKPVDAVVILDNNWDEHLLRRAAEMALGWNGTVGDDGVCVPPILLAARGAALRAREWGEYYEGWEREMADFDRWSREDVYDENCEDDGGECDEYDEL